MFLLKFVDTFCNIVYYFYPLDKIPINIEYNKLNDDFRKCLKKPYQYFNWRKYAYILMFPLIFFDIILNILNYKNLEKKLVSVNISEKDFNYNIQNININNTIIEFLNNRSVKDYVILYSVIPLLFIILELFFVFISYYYREKWLKSKKYLIISSYLSISWIYLIFLFPLTKLLDLSNSSDIFKSYVNMYIILNLLKEITPIIYNLYLGINWSCLNFKILYPDNIYIGQIYSVVTNIYFFNVGFILLIFIQISRNYLITGFILCNLLSILIPKLLFTRYLKYVYCKNDIDELEEVIVTMRYIKKFFISVSIILLFIYLFTGYSLLNTKLSIDNIFILQLFIKFLYRNVYFKVLMGDIIFERLLFLEKYRYLYDNLTKNHNLYFRKIEKELYIEANTNYNNI